MSSAGAPRAPVVPVVFPFTIQSSSCPIIHVPSGAITVKLTSGLLSEEVILSTPAIVTSLPEIFEAADGVEGVKAYQKIQPDLVTLDVNMPRADGIQALRAILKMNPKAKVVMISSVEEKHTVQDAMRIGARDYVVKPFDRSNVPLVLNRVIRQR